MIERLDTWILLAILMGILCCALAAALGNSRRLAQELHKRERELRAAERQADQMKMERDIVRARDEAARCHAARIRDEIIEQQERELRALRTILRKNMEEAKK